MGLDKELIGATTRILVLSALAKEPDYGYGLIKRINVVADGLFEWHEGTVYPVLHKLEKEGCLRTQWQEADSGRCRKYYYITAKGREMLTERKRSWRDLNVVVGRLGEIGHAP